MTTARTRPAPPPSPGDAPDAGSTRPPDVAPAWMTMTLRAAGLYNVVWGAVVVLLPHWTLGVLGLGVEARAGAVVPFWQCIGMIVGVYGVAYWSASRRPDIHWAIVLVGLLGKILGPIGFVDAALIRQQIPPTFAWTLITNDLIWWIPFALILRYAWRRAEQRRALAIDADPRTPADLETALASARATGGVNLAALSRASPLLIVILRHFGCTFCREALADLSAARGRLSGGGVRLVLVHMLDTPDDPRAVSAVAARGLEDAILVADPSRNLHRVLELRRGTMGELFGARIWIRGFLAGVLDRHGVGALAGDGFQLGGAFLVHHARVVRAFRQADAADRPDYCRVALGVPRAAGG